MSVVIENEFLESTGLSEKELKLELAIALYKQGRLSIGQACKFVNLNRIEFQRELASRKEYLNYDIDDLSEDLKTIREFKS